MNVTELKAKAEVNESNWHVNKRNNQKLNMK